MEKKEKLIKDYREGLTVHELLLHNVKKFGNLEKALEVVDLFSREILVKEAERDEYIFRKVYLKRLEECSVENAEFVLSHINWMLNFLKDIKLLNSRPSVELDPTMCSLGRRIAVESFEDEKLKDVLEEIHEDLHNLAGYIYKSLREKRYADALLNYQKCLKTSHNLISLLSVDTLRIVKVAYTDALTGLLTRRVLEKVFKDVLDLSNITGRPFSLAMVDIDNFKKINDLFGHLAGDYVLMEVATIMRKTFRKSDFLFRYGGEEFLILLPSTSLEEAVMVLEKFRKNVENHKFFFEGKEIPVTVSAGVCSSEDKKESVYQYIDCADMKLYTAKRSGKNRVVF